MKLVQQPVLILSLFSLYKVTIVIAFFLILIINPKCCFCGKASSSLRLPNLSSITSMVGGMGRQLPSSYGLMSTLRVVRRLCLGPKLSPWDAQAFFDCYDAAPKGGKAIYVKCQKRVNGYILNTPENLKRSCMEIYKFPQYAMCLRMEFQNAKIDMNKAVDRVNACEEKLLGTN